MKTDLNINEFATKIFADSENKEDFVYSTNDLTVCDNASRIHLDNDRTTFAMNDHFHGQMAAALNIPKKYYDRMKETNAQLLESNINSWFEKEPKNRMVRTLNGQARAYLSDKYKRIDNDRIFSIIAPVLSDIAGVVVESAAVTSTKMWLKVISPKTEREIKLNDPIQAGMVISNSEVGCGAYDIQPYTKRLVCLNGMTVNDTDTSMRTTHLGRKAESGLQITYAHDTIERENEFLLSKSRDIAKAIVEGDWFDAHVEKLRDAHEQKIEDRPSKSVGKLAKAFNLNETEQENVLMHFMSGGDFNKFGLAQAVTRTAEDLNDYDRASAFESLGNRVINLNKSEWNQIAVAA